VSKPEEQSQFDALLTKIHAAGMAWIEAQLKSRQLEEDQKSYLASLMNALEFEGEKSSEAKLDRLARGSQSYREYVTAMCLAWAEAQRLKIRYDNLQMLLDARRSELAMARAKVEKGIFHSGS
jgi:hypothetical protein